MTEKSYVGMAHEVCPVCCTEHTPSVLIDKRLKPTLSQHEFSGWSMCAEHQKLKDDGYIALVVCTGEPKSLAEADRTGDIIHIRASAWDVAFNTPVPPKGLAFIDQDAFAKLRALEVSA